MSTASDERFMAHAIELARRGLWTTSPNPRVGCVLVRDGRIISEGWHERAGGPHAEAAALAASGGDARGSTAYVTLEPCAHHGRTPPCSRALLDAGITRVVVATEDPDPRVSGQGLRALRVAGVEIACGVEAEAARSLNPGFFKRMLAGRPFVRLKVAASLDGRTALASGESRWITGEAARADVHQLRARACAVLTGSGTLLADDPGLDVRLGAAAPEIRQPLRVVLDSRLRTPPGARTLSRPGRVLVITATPDADARSRLEAAGAEVCSLPAGPGGVRLDAVLEALAEREINEVHVEAGATLAGALMTEGLVDELVLYTAPVLLGDTARPMLHLPGIERMHERIELELTEVTPIGEDLRLTARPRLRG